VTPDWSRLQEVAAPLSSPRIRSLSWGRIELEDGRTFKDAKLFPGGAREWEWSETGTSHERGIQPGDVRELIDRGAEVVILSRGMNRRLGVHARTTALLESHEIEFLELQTEEAVDTYNWLQKSSSVAGLFHSTC
jgi:hypothetical protein